MGGKRPKNRRTKTVLVFDESARQEYLTGFKKRKDERRKKAQEQMLERVKEERKQMKEKHRQMLKKAQSRLQKEAKDMEKLIMPCTYQSSEHTVTVTDLGDSSLMGQNRLLLGNNQITGGSDDEIETETNEKSKDEKSNKTREIPKTHKLTKKNKLIAKPSYKKSKHKSFTHGMRKSKPKQEGKTSKHIQRKRNKHN